MATKQEKPKYEQTFKLRTPVSDCAFFHVFEGQKSKDPKYGPKYTLTIKLTDKDARAFEAQVNKFVDAMGAEAKKTKPKTIVVPFSIDDDKEGIPTMFINKDATFKDGSPTPPPPVYDANLQQIKDKIMAGTGTKVAVSVEVSTSLKDGVLKASKPKLRAVQVVELVEYVGTGGSKQIDASSDFEATEGYTFTATPEQETTDDGDQSF